MAKCGRSAFFSFMKKVACVERDLLGIYMIIDARALPSFVSFAVVFSVVIAGKIKDAVYYALYKYERSGQMYNESNYILSGCEIFNFIG